jgi:hypothetical protein
MGEWFMLIALVLLIIMFTIMYQRIKVIDGTLQFLAEEVIMDLYREKVTRYEDLAKKADEEAAGQLAEELANCPNHYLAPVLSDYLVSVGRPAVKPLLERLDGMKGWNRLAAQQALEKITGFKVPKSLDKVREWASGG